MPITASMLRLGTFRILDRVLSTGEPIMIEWKGRRLMLVPAGGPGWMECLPRKEYLRVDPEEIVAIDWSSEDSDPMSTAR